MFVVAALLRIVWIQAGQEISEEILLQDDEEEEDENEDRSWRR